MNKVQDAVLNVNRKEMIKGAKKFMSIGQQMDPAKCVSGIAAAFLLIAESYGVTPQKAMEVAGRALADSKTDSSVMAIQDLMANELKDV